jgi:sortase B
MIDYINWGGFPLRFSFTKESDIKRYLDGEDMIFQITALFVTDIGFDYIAPDPAGDDLTSFFETIARKNWLDFDGVTFSEEDTVLTLSTCCRKYDKANSGNQRLVVMAKLLPEGATAQEFSVSLVDSPEMP